MKKVVAWILVIANALLLGCGHLSDHAQRAGDTKMSEQVLTLDVFNQPLAVLKITTKLDVPLLEKMTDKQVGRVYSFTTKEGLAVRQKQKEDHTIWEEWSREDSNFLYVSLYSSDGSLHYRGASFYNSALASSKYKQSGKAFEFNDTQSKYQFKLEDLRRLILEKFNLDILKKSALHEFDMEERGQPPKPYYFVSVFEKENPDHYRTYLIDGNTGEILHSKETRYEMTPLYTSPEQDVDVYEDYQRQLKAPSSK